MFRHHSPFRLRRVLCAVTMALICELSFSVSAAAQFETRSTTGVGPRPTAIAVGDFNHDGKLDAAVATSGNGQVAVLLGNGDGTFKPSTRYSMVGAPLSIAAADLNRDGNLDLVSANGDGGVSVLLGNGDGTFQPPKNYNTTASSLVIAVGDFNGDHIPDLVVADAPYVSVLLGNGDGTFQAPIDNATLPTYLPSITVGDFNGDGKLDVAAAAPNTGFVAVGILLGNGDGTLQPAVIHPVNFQPNSIIAADFNRDGKLDLAYTGGVLLGNGDGTFQPELFYPLGGTQMAAGDLNGDSKPDIAVADFVSPSGVSVFLGNGDGTLKSATIYPAGTEPRFVTIGDFNGDHKQDLVVTDNLYNHVNVLLNTGVVTFSPTSPLNFSPQLVNTTSTPLLVTLTNTGITPLSISSIAVKGEFHLSGSTSCSTIVAAGANCMIGATFAPLRMGTRNGSVSIVDSASSKPQVIELAGSGTVVSLSPAQLSFPPQRVGTKSTPLTVTVTNEGGTTVTVSSIGVGGTNWVSQDFSETDNCISQPLAPQASCAISITFKPKKAGPRGATLFVNDDGGGKTQTAALGGTGT